MCNSDDGECPPKSWTDFWEEKEAAKQKLNDEIDAIRQAKAEKENCSDSDSEDSSSQKVKDKIEDDGGANKSQKVKSEKGKCNKGKIKGGKSGSGNFELEKVKDNIEDEVKLEKDKVAQSAEKAGQGIFSMFSQLSSALPTDDKKLTGKYAMVKSENFDEYMKEVGVGLITRKLGNASKPVTEITKDDSSNEWRIKTSTTFKTTNIAFKLGVPFQEETADGRKCESTITKQGAKLIHAQKCDKKDYEIIRDFKDDEMTMTLKAGDVVSKRVYKKS